MELYLTHINQMRVHIILLLLSQALAGWADDIDETAEFLIRVGATKYEVAWGLREMLNNRKWTNSFNFLIIGNFNRFSLT